MMLKYFLSFIKEALFSNGCIVCENPIDFREAARNPAYHLCPDCMEKWRKEISICKSSENIITVSVYDKKVDSVTKSIILKAKEDNSTEISDFIAYEILSVLNHQKLMNYENTVVTYAPRDKSKIRNIGFDHMRYAAKSFSKLIELPSCCAFEHINGLEQKKLDHKKRVENAEKSIQLTTSAYKELVGKNVIIIDDVMTTGATLRRCKRLAEEAGALNVICAALARGCNNI